MPDRETIMNVLSRGASHVGEAASAVRDGAKDVGRNLKMVAINEGKWNELARKKGLMTNPISAAGFAGYRVFSHLRGQAAKVMEPVLGPETTNDIVMSPERLLQKVRDAMPRSNKAKGGLVR